MDWGRGRRTGFVVAFLRSLAGCTIDLEQGGVAAAKFQGDGSERLNQGHGPTWIGKIAAHSGSGRIHPYDQEQNEESATTPPAPGARTERGSDWTSRRPRSFPPPVGSHA